MSCRLCPNPTLQTKTNERHYRPRVRAREGEGDVTLESLGYLLLGFVFAQVFFWFGYAVGLGLLKREKHD